MRSYLNSQAVGAVRIKSDLPTVPASIAFHVANLHNGRGHAPPNASESDSPTPIEPFVNGNYSDAFAPTCGCRTDTLNVPLP